MLGEGEYMNVTERMSLIRIIDKMNEHKEFSKKLGLQNASEFKKSRGEKRERFFEKEKGEDYEVHSCGFRNESVK